MPLDPEEVVQETMEIQSPVIKGGRRVVITYRRDRPVVSATMMIMVGLLLLLFGSIIASQKFTLAVQSGLFAVTPLFCIITGALALATGSMVDSPLVNKVLFFSVLSALASCAAAIIYFLDTINYSWYTTDNDMITTFSAVSLSLTFMELGLSIGVSTKRWKKYCHSVKHVTIVNPLYGLPTVTGQTLPTNHMPPTASQAPLNEAQAPPLVHEEPPDYNSIIT